MPTDLELLHQFSEQGDDAAFTELVRRQTDFVFSTAWRVTNQAALAEDVTQKVFLKMADRSRALCHYTTLIGWLHMTTRHVALDAVRGEARRRTLEQEASAMTNHPATPESDWAELRPILDEAVDRLAECDRTAVLLRFFSELSYRDAGVMLGLSEDATRKRIDRALEKLRAYFARRGVTMSSALLAASITTNSVHAAPAGLAAQAAQKSLAAKSAGATAGITGAITFLKFLFMSTQNKIILGAFLAALVTIGLVMKYTRTPASPPAVASIGSFPATNPTVVAPVIPPGPSSTIPLSAKVISKLTLGTVEAPLAKAVEASASTDLSAANPQDPQEEAMLKLGKAYFAYSLAGNKTRTIQAQPGDSAHDAAFILARDAGLNDASIYFVPGDPAAPNPVPKNVIGKDGKMDPDFAKATLSIIFVGLTSPNAPMTTTPLAWTRGLREDGTWAPDSPFHGKGGYIVYLDGQVVWRTSLSTANTAKEGAYFIGYPTSTMAGLPTANFHDAISSHAVILEAEPSEKNN